MGSRPRIALVLTTWFENSHADVLARRLIEGYEWGAGRVEPRVEVVAAYLDRPGTPDDDRPELGPAVLAERGIPMYGTVAEAMLLGGSGPMVDGVVIVGEHGAYGQSAFEQTLYPRRRLIEAALSVMVARGRVVPVFSDKHLSWDVVDALQLAATVERLGVPLLAGSSVPVAWRSGDLGWPCGEPMTHTVAVGYGGVEPYGAHLLELAQSFHEQRAGGECGVAEVTALTGDAAWAALDDGTVPRDLYERALTVGGGPADDVREQLRHHGTTVFHVRHHDGLLASYVMHDRVGRFSVAARGPRTEAAARALLAGARPWGHFAFLARLAEDLVLTGRPAWPLARVVLTSGVLDAAMRSLVAGRHGAPVARPTPDLAIAYAAPDPVIWAEPGPPVPADAG